MSVLDNLQIRDSTWYKTCGKKGGANDNRGGGGGGTQQMGREVRPRLSNPDPVKDTIL